MKTAAEILQAVGLPLPPNGESRYSTTSAQTAPTNGNLGIKNSNASASRSPKKVCSGVANHCGWKGGEFFNGKDDDPIVATYEYTDEDGKVLSAQDQNGEQKILATKTGW
jgi:hypothetical protein